MRAKQFFCFNNNGRIFGTSKMHFSLSVAKAAVRSKAVVLIVLFYCLLLFPLFVRILCLVLFCYLVLCVCLVLQSS